MDVRKQIENTGLVPVVVIDNVTDAVGAAIALKVGGVDVMEITLRTDAGMDAIAAVSESDPEILVGAGTVLSLANAKEAVARGAKFIVSPGFDADIVSWCLGNEVAVFPGCVTPTEITAAVKFGLDVVKFFPANVYGGVNAIKALAGPFPNVRFIPTGGIGGGNLSEFIIPQVAAVGGGWLCPRKAIRENDFAAITEACAKSVDIVKSHR